MKTRCWKCNGIRDIDIEPDPITGTIDSGHATCTCGGTWSPVG